MSEVLETLTSYIRDEFGYDGPLDPDVDLLEEQILDSFSIVQMAMHIQEAFDIELEPEELVRDNLSTLSGMLAMVEKHRA